MWPQSLCVAAWVLSSKASHSCSVHLANDEVGRGLGNNHYWAVPALSTRGHVPLVFRRLHALTSDCAKTKGDIDGYMWGGTAKEETVLRTGFHVLWKAQSPTPLGAKRALEKDLKMVFLQSHQSRPHASHHQETGSCPLRIKIWPHTMCWVLQTTECLLIFL